MRFPTSSRGPGGHGAPNHKAPPRARHRVLIDEGMMWWMIGREAAAEGVCVSPRLLALGGIRVAWWRRLTLLTTREISPMFLSTCMA
jgi:hypothetical protein